MEVVVEELRRSFGKTRAVDGLSFRMRGGQVFAFVGPNGAGKTTTMRIMSTLDTPDSGDVRIDGVSVPLYPEKARRLLGYMPDSLPAHRDIVVHEYLDFFARAFGLRTGLRRGFMAEIEEFTGLGPLREKPLSGLSKGMKQRVSLARALLHDPPLLILDEPAAGLDPRARIELRELLVALARRGKAILISSHILNELEEMSDGVVIIERGRLIRAGTLDEIHAAVSAGPLNGEALAGSNGHANGVSAPPAPTRRLAVRTLGDPEALHRALLESPGVAAAREVGRAFEVDVRGDDEAVAALLAGLVSAGHRVVEFRPLKTGLERLFMEATKGEVQ